MSQDIHEDKLVVWWGPDLEKEEVFVVPIASVEEGVKTLGMLTAYDEFLIKNKIREDKVSNGALAFLGSDGNLKPWSYVSIAHGGEKFDDPMKWLEVKYAKSSIIT